jgi:tetratricopeptide (TPR) repeat protein
MDGVGATVQAYLVAGELGRAIELGQQQLARAERSGQSLEVAPLALVLAQAAGHVGQYQWSQNLADQARQLYDQAGKRGRAGWAAIYWAIATVELGHEPQALSTLSQTLSQWDRDSDVVDGVSDLAAAQCLAAGVWLDGSTPDGLDQAWDLAQAALKSAQRSELDWVAMVSLAYLATVHLRLGERARALTLSNRGMDLMQMTGQAAGHEPLLYFTHAQALRVQGDSRAVWYWQRARQTVACRALSLIDRRMRHSYLHNVRLNQAIGRH